MIATRNPYEAGQLEEGIGELSNGRPLLWFGILLQMLAAVTGCFAVVFPQLAKSTAPPGQVQFVVVCLCIGGFALFLLGVIAILGHRRIQNIRQQHELSKTHSRGTE